MEGAPDASQFIELANQDRGVGFDFQLDVHLTEDEARTLQEELYSYMRRYQAKWTAAGRERTQGYQFMVAFTPMVRPGEE